MTDLAHRLQRHLKSRRVRASAESSLEVAAAVPNSRFAFVDNSQGASAAVAELSGFLDLAVEEIDFQGRVILVVGLPTAMPIVLTGIYHQEHWASNSESNWIGWTRRPRSTRILV
jgi:hypothetical protein